MSDTIEKLQKLGELFDAGIITKEELESEKAKILGARDKPSSTSKQMSTLRKWLFIGIAAIALIGVIVFATRKTPEELYHQGVAYVNGAGVPRDVEKGIKLLTRSANKGNALAMREIARTLVGGGKTTLGLIWYDKAIRAGDAPSAKYLGKAYMFGDDFFGQDYTKAVQYNNAAIELDQNDAEPYVNLGVCYYNGYGTGIDYAKAYEYFQRAADLNSPEGLYNLGICYENGNGVARNHDDAVNYIKKAAALGDQSAISYVNELERRQRRAYNQQKVVCPDCKGRGWTRVPIGEGTMECMTCYGYGYVTRESANSYYDRQEAMWNTMVENSIVYKKVE